MKKVNKAERMRRIFAMVCALMVAVALVASLVVPVLAVSQQQLDDAKQKTEDTKKDLENAEAKHKAILDEFNAVDKQISDTEAEIEQIESQITQTENDIILKQEELVKAEEDYELYKGLFLSRARVMYENSDLKYLEILFGAKNFSDFLSKVEMISQLMEYDRSILNKLNETKTSIENAKKELEDILVRQEDYRASLEDKRGSLDVILAEKQKLLDETWADVERYKVIHEAAEREEQKLIDQNRSSFQSGANPVKYTGGKFAWPVPASHRITSYYGMRNHPVYKTPKFHSGIDIGAGYGLEIRAAADGVVTLAATNGGYGKCVVINHGSGITTLYAHCSSINVSVGEKVSKGQLIAKVGSTGVSTGPHLHFEVRINGTTTDPLKYVSN
ncbi:MAG: peptidase M23 [Ruminococcaceae bacterium]|nr:peptidase M23 [Oscillospiraceae bacterium]